MLLILLIQLFTLSFSKISLLNYDAEIIHKSQTWCLSLIPEQASSKELMSAFLCGRNIQNHQFLAPFQRTGLIHLLVVSGGHCAFLILALEFFGASLFSRFPRSKFLISLTLSGYSLMTGFQPPVVKALAAIYTRDLAKYFRLHWSQGQIQWISGFFLLSLFPDWITSFSFYLSWLASLGLCFGSLWSAPEKSLQMKVRNWLLTCLTVQSLLSLFFWKFSLLSLFSNIVIAPLLMLLLWPLFLLTVLFPHFFYLTDNLCDHIMTALNYISDLGTSKYWQGPLPEANWFYLWSLIIGIHCLLETLTRKRFRGYAI